jgi:hypothetical protein
MFTYGRINAQKVLLYSKRVSATVHAYILFETFMEILRTHVDSGLHSSPSPQLSVASLISCILPVHVKKIGVI